MQTKEGIPLDSKIVVVGGSLVGPLAGQIFRNCGFEDVKIIEAVGPNSMRSGGIIGVSDTAEPALNKAGLSTSDIAAHPSRVIQVVNIDGDRNVENAGSVDYAGINSTWDLIHSAASERGPIAFGRRVVDIRPSSDGAELSDSQGVIAKAGLVVFADGRTSIGRAKLDPDRQTEYQGIVVFRGMTENPSTQPSSYTRYHNPDMGTYFTISAPITSGHHEGKVDWDFYLNVRPEFLADLIGGDPASRYYLFPNQITPDVRNLLISRAQEHLPDDLIDTIGNTENVTLSILNGMRVPDRTYWPIGTNAHAVLLGDALMPISPLTARGFNNGVEQAESLTWYLTNFDTKYALETWSRIVCDAVAEWKQRGLARDQQLGLGFDSGAYQSL